MKKIILILFLGMFFTQVINAQQVIHIKAKQDLAPFTGTWVGEKNDMRYEITFKEGIRKVELNGTKYAMELVFASSVKWFKNEKLIREFHVDAPKSILEGVIGDIDPLFLAAVNYYDKEKGFNGEGSMVIDSAQNPQRARLNLAPTYIGKNKGKMDFPTTLELTKVK